MACAGWGAPHLRSSAVLILLPPSEGKAAPRRGRPVDLGALAFPELAPQRAALMEALRALCAGPPAPALTALGLSAAQEDELGRDARLAHAPAAPAARIYTGVLYEHLSLASLPAPARRRAAGRVLVSSALWGVVRPGDRIPAYRLPMGARLPGRGGLAAWWRPALTAALPEPGLLVDLRSDPYAAAWRPKESAVVRVRAFQEGPGGERAAISHMVKATRGRVARSLLEAPRAPRDPHAVAGAVAAAGFRVELERSGADWSLDVIEPRAGARDLPASS
jgi:uncharacterized protein